MKYAAIIPARSGSKRLKEKNTKVMYGKPMISWTIEAAINSRCFETIFITTNDAKVVSICDDYPQVRVINRPDKLTSDQASTNSVIHHILDFFNDEDCYVLLQPTSPLRNSTHIKDAIQVFEEKRSSHKIVSLFSVSNKIINKDWSLFIRPENGIVVRQDTDCENLVTKFLNGAIYINLVDSFRCDRGMNKDSACVFEMPPASSFDVDEIGDFLACEEKLKMTRGLS